jgi:uncharacterized membrane protein YjjB (DUF3815 family)
VPAAAFTAVFFALASYAPPRALLGAGLGGLTSFTVYGLAIFANLGPTASAVWARSPSVLSGGWCRGGCGCHRW